MIGLSNFDTSFFKIEVVNSLYDKGITTGTPLFVDITEHIISFSVTEQAGQMMHGTLSIFDTEYHGYSWMLKMGRKLKIQWGYENKDFLADTMAQTADPKAAIGMKTIRYLYAYIKNPSGAASEGGQVTYNCEFMAYESAGGQSVGSYKSGTKESVVRTVLTRMGVDYQFVKFRRGNEKVTKNTAIRQDNITDFKFLNRYAQEWGCVFRIGYNAQYSPVALFCNYDDDLFVESFMSSVMGSSGINTRFDWKLGAANVKSYSWQYNSVEGGVGDNVRITMGSDGQPRFNRTIAETNTVVVYKMNASKISADMAKGASAGALMQTTGEMLKINTMDELVKKGYFIKSKETTAPQGVGLTMSLEAIGNPWVLSPGRAIFGEGFPDIFRTKMLFYITSVTHNISRAGYMMSVKIADAFSVSGGTMVG